MEDVDRARKLTRRLKILVEPVAASVYYCPEAPEAYAEVGLPAKSAYFCSRSAALGRVRPEVVVSAFGTFPAHRVIPAIEAGWDSTTPEAVIGARQKAASAALTRLIGGPSPAVARATALLRQAGQAAPFSGHILFAGLRSLPAPADPMAALWLAADTLREHRGDSHVNAWVAAGLLPLEIVLLSALWSHRPLEMVARSGWSEEDIAGATQRLGKRGLMTEAGFTPAGESLRAEIEAATDRQELPIVDALREDELEELFGILRVWSEQIVKAGGLPGDPAAAVRL